jgi:hypothetical protein
MAFSRAQTLTFKKATIITAPGNKPPAHQLIKVNLQKVLSFILHEDDVFPVIMQG